MKRINTILGIGIALLLMPLLGFPSAWRNFFLFVLGLWLCYLALSERGILRHGGGNIWRIKKSGIENTAGLGTGKETPPQNTHE